MPNPMFILQTSRLQMFLKPLRSPQFVAALSSAKALEPLVYVVPYIRPYKPYSSCAGSDEATAKA